MSLNRRTVQILSCLSFLLTVPAGASIVVPEKTANDVRGYTAANTSITTATAGLVGPVGAAVDAANNVYVTNSADGTGSVVKYTPTLGGPTSFLASGSGLNQPAGIAFDTSGNAYVANQGTYAGQSGAQQGGVVQVSPAGTVLATFALGSSRVPAGIAFTSSANPTLGAGYTLYVAESATNTLNVYSTTNIAAAAGVLAPGGALALNAPADVAADSTRGIVYIANSGTTGTNANTIEAYNIATNTFSLFASGAPLNVPQGLAVDPTGNVFVSNAGTGTIQEYTAAGVAVGGLFASGLASPQYLAYTPVTVPEPASLALLLPLLLLSRRNRRAGGR